MLRILSNFLVLRLRYLILNLPPAYAIPFPVSALALLFGWQEGRLACKKLGVVGDRRFARFIATLIALVVITTCIILSSNRIQNGDILVSAYPHPPGKRAIKMESKRGLCCSSTLLVLSAACCYCCWTGAGAAVSHLSLWVEIASAVSVKLRLIMMLYSTVS